MINTQVSNINSDRLMLTIYAVVTIAFLVSIKIIAWGKPYPYTDDWIYTQFLDLTTSQDIIIWLFTQHVDHYIPIQKIVHSYVATLYGYDFRYVIGLNLLIELITCIFLLKTAKLYRGGYYTVGDLSIPLIVMNPAAGPIRWAFSFQFLSSIFFMSGFLYFHSMYNCYDTLTFKSFNKAIYLELSILFLLLCSLCGLNGLIASSILGAIIIGNLVYTKQIVSLEIWAKLLFLTLVVLNIFLWASWKPSGAVSTNVFGNFLFIFDMVFTMLRGSMVNFGHIQGWWTSLFVLILVTLAILLIYLDRKFFISNISFAGILLFNLVTLLLISIGRAKYLQDGGSYQMVAIFHYGDLSILLPIISWIIISKFQNLLVKTLGVVIFGIFLTAYFENLEWINKTNVANQKQTKKILVEFKSNENIIDIVNKFTSNLTHRDTKSEKSAPINGITTLRKHHVDMYSLHIELAKAYEQNAADFLKSAIDLRNTNDYFNAEKIFRNGMEKYSDYLDQYNHPAFKKELMRMLLSKQQWQEASLLIPKRGDIGGEYWHEILFARAYTAINDVENAKLWWLKIIHREPLNEQAKKFFSTVK